MRYLLNFNLFESVVGNSENFSKDLEKIKDYYLHLGCKINVFLKTNNILHIKDLNVKRKDRNYGIISSFLRKLINLCDKYNITIEVNPYPYDRVDSDLQKAIDRLINFYKRFGFVENKNKSLSNSILLRLPELIA